MSQRYEISNDKILIYDNLGNCVMLMDKDKDELLKKNNIIKLCDSKIDNNILALNKINIKMKNSSKIAFLSAILTSISLFLNASLNLSLLLLMLTGGSIVCFLSLEDKKQTINKTLFFLEREKDILQTNFNNLLKQKYYLQVKNIDIINNEKKKNNCKDTRYDFKYFNEFNENFCCDEKNNFKFKVKRMVKHK